MGYGQPNSEVLNRNQKLALVAATICFLIGWFHTGQGLANYRILGTEYGGYILATGTLLIMTLSYKKAIKGSSIGLAFYLICALVTFICNLNSFYPNYRSDSLIREELRQHRTNLSDLRESIKTQFQDTQLNALTQSINSKSKQLQEQCKQKGFGQLSEDVLRSIENELGRRITRLRLGNTQEDWNNCATRYAVIIQEELNVKLKENRYDDKLKNINFAEENYISYGGKIEGTLADKASLKKLPDYVENLAESYRDSCKKAVLLISGEKGQVENSNPKTSFNFKCDQAYDSKNKELGTFSHTFVSVWNTLNDGGTWSVLLISIFIDFIFPLALYFLVRREESTPTFWTAGMERVGPSVRD